MWRVFGFLNSTDISSCALVCQKWNTIAMQLIETPEGEKLRVSPTSDDFATKFYNPFSELPLLLEEDDIDFLETREMLIDMVVRGSITENEFLKLDDTTDLSEMEGSILDFMLAKNQGKRKSKNVNCDDIQEEEWQQQTSSGDEDELSSLGSEVMKNVTILRQIFVNSELEEIKTFRMVSRKWNYEAEPFFKKRGRFILSSSCSTNCFIEVFSKLPSKTKFTAFKFGNKLHDEELDIHYPREFYNISSMDSFFHDWGNNITSLHLWNVSIREDDTGFTVPHHIGAWLKSMPNLIELSIIRENHSQLKMDLENLCSIKILTLSGCLISVSSKDDWIRIQPQKITLYRVRIYLEGILMSEALLNLYVDFSKATEINITPSSKQVQIFDWGMEKINADTVRLNNINCSNLALSQANVDFLSLRNSPFSEKTHMQVKYMQLVPQTWGFPVLLDLSHLPLNIEELCLALTPTSSVTSIAPIDLPNFNYLKIKIAIGYPPDEADISFVSHFANCPKLFDLEIWFRDTLTLDLSWIPKSVKRLNLNHVNDINFIGDDLQKVQVDNLYLSGDSIFWRKVISKIQPKVLVLGWIGRMKNKKKENTDDILSFVLENPQFERILVGCPKVHDISYPFENSQMYNYVDKKADYYEFVGQRGKAITRERFHEFVNFCSMSDRMEILYDIYKHEPIIKRKSM